MSLFLISKTCLTQFQMILTNSSDYNACNHKTAYIQIQVIFSYSFTGCGKIAVILIFLFVLRRDIHTNINAKVNVTILSLKIKSKNSVKVNDSIHCQVILQPNARENAMQLQQLQTTMQVTKVYPIILFIFIIRTCFMTFLVVSGLRRRNRYRRINGSGTVIKVVYTITQKSSQLKLSKDSLIDFSLYSFSSSSS